MKTSLAHLPEKKQVEINDIVGIIQEVVNPEMIILFGSYAKGKQVDHQYQSGDGIYNEYISDYDFLVVVDKVGEETSSQEWTIEEKAQIYRAPVNLEIHEVDYINKGLEIGQYFFKEIIEQGILLYNRGNVRFATPKELTIQEQKEIALEHYNIWYKQGIEFLKIAKLSFSDSATNLTAFLLHQASESLYYAVLLVYTNYKPKTHNLKKLRKKNKTYSEELFLLFQVESNKQESHLFDLLKKGYVDARYKRDYKITKVEIEELIVKIDKMAAIVEKICNEKIKSFK